MLLQLLHGLLIVALDELQERLPDRRPDLRLLDIVARVESGAVVSIRDVVLNLSRCVFSSRSRDGVRARDIVIRDVVPGADVVWTRGMRCAMAAPPPGPIPHVPARAKRRIALHEVVITTCTARDARVVNPQVRSLGLDERVGRVLVPPRPVAPELPPAHRVHAIDGGADVIVAAGAWIRAEATRIHRGVVQRAGAKDRNGTRGVDVERRWRRRRRRRPCRRRRLRQASEEGKTAAPHDAPHDHQGRDKRERRTRSKDRGPGA